MTLNECSNTGAERGACTRKHACEKSGLYLSASEQEIQNYVSLTFI